MNKTTVRFVQTFVVLALALYATFVCFGNLVDYDSNYQYVKHVLAMDTTFEGNNLMWRAITDETLVTLAYWGIIAVEGTVAILAWVSGVRMLERLKKSDKQFNDAKTAGFYAFMLAILLWFVGFICIGSEWFAMWQSDTWNGKTTAMHIVEMVGVFLVVYMMPVEQALAASKTSK